MYPNPSDLAVGIPLPEPDELVVAWGANKNITVVEGCTTFQGVADVLRVLADAYERAGAMQEER